MESALPFGSYLHSLPADDALLACGLLLPLGLAGILALILAAFVSLFAPIRGA